MMKALMVGLVIVAGEPIILAGTVTQIKDFGDNPTDIGMYLYTPANLTANPAVVVGVHACHGKGTDVCSSNNAFAQQADKWGFLLICPSAVSSDGCWDVHSTKVMTHNGGGDAQGIISMVKYVIAKLNGDANRVFVMGHSSGGMATNILLGSYPDVFKAGSAYAGVPFGCYGTGTVDNLGWNTNCAQGKIIKTGEAWGSMVRAAFPGFSGTRPRIQLWHGTKDDVLYFQNFREEIKQWTNVLRVSETPSTIENNSLQPTWIRTRYKDANGVVQVEAIEETGQPHNLMVDAAEAMRFLGLDGANMLPDAGAPNDKKDASTLDRADTPIKQDVSMDLGGSPTSADVPPLVDSSGGVVSTGGAASTGGIVQTGDKTGLGGMMAQAGAMTGEASMGGSRSDTKGNNARSGCSLGGSSAGQEFSVLAGCIFLLLFLKGWRPRIQG